METPKHIPFNWGYANLGHPALVLEAEEEEIIGCTVTRAFDTADGTNFPLVAKIIARELGDGNGFSFHATKDSSGLAWIAGGKKIKLALQKLPEEGETMNDEWARYLLTNRGKLPEGYPVRIEGKSKSVSLWKTSDSFIFDSNWEFRVPVTTHRPIKDTELQAHGPLVLYGSRGTRINDWSRCFTKKVTPAFLAEQSQRGCFFTTDGEATFPFTVPKTPAEMEPKKEQPPLIITFPAVEEIGV